MFRLWAKLYENQHLCRDTVIENNLTDINRTKKVFSALEQVCYEFDLSKPIWLDNNISEFQKVSKTRFNSDNFIDSFPYDFLEIQVIEEDLLLP